MQAHTVKTTDDYHDLIAHLFNDDGGALWVPGAKPHTRNEPMLFAPYNFSVRPHPVNPEQTPVLMGSLVGATTDEAVLHCVALGHLAHDRGECARCEPVWRTAAEQWAEVPDEGHHEALFGFVELAHRENGLAVRLLLHIDDVPADWYDA